jgi:predicted transposase/invertase (TIGR01784 family)
MAQITEQLQAENTLLSLRNDAVFKLFFARQENIKQLKVFLKATTHLTDDDLVKIDLLDTTLTKEHVQEKDYVVDVRIKDASGNYTHIEMQMRRHGAFVERIVAYNSRQYSSQLSRGQDYVELKKSITLVITDFPMFDDSDDYFEYITYRRENRKIFTNAQEYFILDLTKLPDEVKDSKARWGALFKAETKEELSALMAKFDELNEAGEKLLDLSKDKYAQEIARAREESQWAWKHTLYHTEKRGREEGREEGLEQGLELGRIKAETATAKSLLETGMSVEEVAKHVELDVEKINALIS